MLKEQKEMISLSNRINSDIEDISLLDISKSDKEKIFALMKSAVSNLYEISSMIEIIGGNRNE